MNRDLLRHEQRKRSFQSYIIAFGVVGTSALLLWEFFGPLFALVTASIIMLMIGRAAREQTALLLRRMRPLSWSSAPGLHRLVRSLAERAGLERSPALYIWQDRTLNAMAIRDGDQHGIVISQGLLNRLNERELTGVLAHEIGHIRNRDLGLFRLISAARGIVQAMAQVGWLLLLIQLPYLLFSGGGSLLPLILLMWGAPVALMLLERTLLRTREYAADLAAAEMTGDPLGLASALNGIEQARTQWWNIFMPMGVKREATLWDTHPATAERIRELKRLSTTRRERPGVSIGAYIDQR